MASLNDKKFLMGPKGVLHMDPAHEECNIDEIPRHRRRRYATEADAQAAGMRRRCEHCWPKVVANPEAQTTESEEVLVAPTPESAQPADVLRDGGFT